MATTVKRHWPGVLAGYAVLVALLVLVTTPAYRLAEPSWRPTVVRVAAALLLGVALLHARGTLRAAIEDDEQALLEATTRRQPVEPSLDRQFMECRSAIRWSIRDRRYFESTLWPQLRVLVAEQPSARRESLTKPPARRFRRGPSLSAMRELIATLERPE